MTSRTQYQPAQAVQSDRLEPVDPVYMKPPRPSPISAHLRIPSEPTTWKAPVVMRLQDMSGTRYMYAYANPTRQPLQQLGNGPDLGIAVWTGEFQPEQHHQYDWGFYDRLYRAGYPGFNLGLSFKVQSINGSPGTVQIHSPGANMTMKRKPWFTHVVSYKRTSGAPSTYKGQGQPLTRTGN